MLFSQLFYQSRDNKRRRICFGSIGRWGACRPFLLARACSMPPPPPFLETIVTINLTEARTIMQRENRCSLLASFFIDGSQNHRDFNFREKQSYTTAESISYLRVTCGQQTSMFRCLEKSKLYGAFVDFLRCNM